MQSVAVPNFPAIFRLIKHHGDHALFLQIKALVGDLAVSFYGSMVLAINNSVWAQSNIFVADSAFDGMPHIFRILMDLEVRGTASGEDGQKEEISYALPLPIEVMHWMRHEAGMKPIIPVTPPEYCDDFTFNLAFYCRISGSIEEADIHFRRNLAKSISFPGQGSYAGTPSHTVLEHLERLGRVHHSDNGNKGPAL